MTAANSFGECFEFRARPRYSPPHPATKEGRLGNMREEFETMMCRFEIEARARDLRAQWIEQFRIIIAHRLRSWLESD